MAVGDWDSGRWITDNDMTRSRTAHCLEDLRRAVEPLRRTGMRRFLDIGCGFGGLSALVGEYIGAQEVHGVDIDHRVVSEAQGKNVAVVLADAGDKPLPYPDGHFDVIMTLGMMDYLVSFDAMLREVNRLLRPGGSVLVSLPNLASWHNRAMLLLGFQPRDVEISSEVLVGVPPGYAGENPAGHIHIPTVRAFVELMEHHGFGTRQVTGGRPMWRRMHPVLFATDALLARRPALARRFFYLGTKERVVPAPEHPVLLPHQSLTDGAA